MKSLARLSLCLARTRGAFRGAVLVAVLPVFCLDALAAGLRAEACNTFPGCGNVNTIGPTAIAVASIQTPERTGSSRAEASFGELLMEASLTSINQVAYQSARAEFVDRVLVTFPNGAGPVNVTFTLARSSSCIGVGCPAGGAGSPSLGIGLQHEGPNTVSRTFTINTPSTFDVDLFGEIYVFTPFSSTSAYYRTSLEISVDSPLAQMFSDSGHNYAPVPEPGSGALAIAGGLLLSLRFRKTRVRSLEV